MTMRKAIEVGKVRSSQRKGNHSVRLECRVNEGNSGKYRQKRSNVGSTMEGLEYQIGESIIKCSVCLTTSGTETVLAKTYPHMSLLFP